MRDLDITLDVTRKERVGLDEAVFSESKTVEQLTALVDEALRTGARRLFTRLSNSQFEQLSKVQRDCMDYDALSRTAIIGGDVPLREKSGIAVLCAGSSDAAVTREALRTLQYYGYGSTYIADVGVAGLWRLLEHLDTIRAMDVVIVAAGMDGALPSVVGGLVPGSVIAVPTSVGYGAGAGGAAALASNLASCAPGVVVVNIDNGYGAACAALRIIRHR